MRHPSPVDDRACDDDSGNGGALPELVTESFGDTAEGFSGGAAKSVIELTLWECNVASFVVFRLCRLEGIGVGGGMSPGFVHWTGISPPQIDSACRLCSIPRAHRDVVADDVSYMGDRVADERNRQQKANR